MTKQTRISRRSMLRSSLAAAGATLLCGCGFAGTQGSTSNTPQTQNTAIPATDQPTNTTSNPTSAPSQTTHTTKIVCMIDAFNDTFVKLNQSWAEQFMQRNPTITIDLQVVKFSDYTSTLESLFASGSAPDIHRYSISYNMIERKLLLPLDDYVKQDNFNLLDFRQNALNLYRHDNLIYAIPRDYGLQSIYYNLDHFEEANIPPLPTDWEDQTFTFEYFLDIAQKLTKKNGDTVEHWGVLVNRSIRAWSSWLYNNGGKLVDTDADGIAKQFTINQPEAVEALQFLQDLMYFHQVSPTPKMESDPHTLFSTGKTSMIITNPSDMSKYRKEKQLRWDVATLPRNKNIRRGTGGGGTAWAISAKTRYPQVAWEYLKFITSPEKQMDEILAGITTPSRLSLITSKEFIQPNQHPKHADMFAQAQEYVVHDPSHPRWRAIQDNIINPNMDNLWNGSKKALEVALKIKQEGDLLLAQG